MIVEPLIIALLLAAAVMHASWNALLKSDESDRLATFGMIMGAGTVLGLAVLPFLPAIERAAWNYLLSSVPIHVAYFALLLKAYHYGDLSHIYPLARGLVPLLVALVSGRLIGEILRPQDMAGVLLLSGGLVALAIPLGGATRPGGRHGLATLFAVLAAIAVAAYIVIDGLGARAAGPTVGHGIAYAAWLGVLGGPWLLAVAAARRPAALWRHLKRTWRSGALGGLNANVGYGIAIFAMVLAPMAHVAALRSTSVLIGALIGTLLLGEPFGTRRVVAAAVIMVGLVLMTGPQFI